MSPSKKSIPAFDFNKSLHDHSAFEFTRLEESYTPYDASHPHRHKYYEVLFFNKAGGNHEVDFQSFPIEENSIHFVSPGQVHLLRRNPDVTGYVFSFAEDFFLDKSVSEKFIDSLPFFVHSSVSAHVSVKEQEQLKELLTIIQNIQKEFLSENSDKGQALVSWMSLFLIFCRRLYTQQTQSSEQPFSKNELSVKFRKLVEKYFAENKSVAEFAQMLNITPGHLNDTVNTETGKTAGEVIHDRMILEAKRLLYHSGKSVKEIAATLNFEDPSYFTKFFKTRTDSTPEQFRKFIREKYH